SPVVSSPVVKSPVIHRPTIASPAVRPPVNYPPATMLPVVEMPVAKSQRARHILLSKPAQTILFVFIFASLPLFIPRLANMFSMKDQAYHEMLPDPHELISFKSSGASDTSIPGGGGPATAETTSSSTGTDTPVIVGSEHPIEDPTNSLNSFYAALARTDAKQSGAVTFTANGPGKYARFAPASTGDTGKNFSRMDVYFLRQPNGGQFSVNVNNENSQTVSTVGDAETSGFYEIKARAPGENTFEVK